MSGVQEVWAATANDIYAGGEYLFYIFPQSQEAKKKITKIMFKGGDETADISAGFHLRRRGGIAKVENLYLHL